VSKQMAAGRAEQTTPPPTMALRRIRPVRKVAAPWLRRPVAMRGRRVRKYLRPVEKGSEMVSPDFRLDGDKPSVIDYEIHS
jgi:hypothetical protein